MRPSEAIRPEHDESTSPTGGLETIVFSRTLRRVTWRNSRICDRDLVDAVRQLKDESDVPVRTMGSLSVVRQLIAVGLVDRLRLMTFPLVAGTSGRESIFAEYEPADLELVDHRVLDGRLLLMEYRPTGRDIPQARAGRAP